MIEFIVGTSIGVVAIGLMTLAALWQQQRAADAYLLLYCGYGK